MKIIYLFVAFLLTSCYSTFKTAGTINPYSDIIEFKIDQVQEGHRINTGNGFWTPSRGNKFVFVFMTFTNKSDEKQDLNFDNILLLDPEHKIKYKAEFSMVTGPVNIWGKIDSFINANDKKSRKLVFPFPENHKPRYLLVNEKLVPIDYL